MLPWAVLYTVTGALGYGTLGWAGLALGLCSVAASYGGSLFAKEWWPCPRCGGDRRKFGIISRRAHSFCKRCTGGSIVRLGVRVFRPGRARELAAEHGRAWWRG